MATQTNQEMMAAIAASFVSEESSYDVLKEGTHIAILTKLRIMHSFLKADGSEKEGSFEWKTPTPLVAITFADKKGSVVMERFHLKGYVRYDELSAKQKSAAAYSSSETGYALKGGDRIVCEKRSKDCIQILSRVFNALDMATGSTLDDLQKIVDAREKEVQIVVGKASEGDFMEVTKVSKVSEAAPVDSDASFN